MSEAVADIPVMIMWSSLSTCHGAPVLLEEDTGKLQQSLAHLALALALEVPQEADRIFRTPSQRGDNQPPLMQRTTSHRWCGRAGRESHDGKANDDEGSPRLQPPAHIRTLALH